MPYLRRTFPAAAVIDVERAVSQRISRRGGGRGGGNCRHRCRACSDGGAERQSPSRRGGGRLGPIRRHPPAAPTNAFAAAWRQDLLWGESNDDVTMMVPLLPFRLVLSGVPSSPPPSPSASPSPSLSSIFAPSFVVVIVDDGDNRGPDPGPRRIRDVRRGVLGGRLSDVVRAHVSQQISRQGGGERGGIAVLLPPWFSVSTVLLGGGLLAREFFNCYHASNIFIYIFTIHFHHHPRQHPL